MSQANASENHKFNRPAQPRTPFGSDLAIGPKAFPEVPASPAMPAAGTQASQEATLRQELETTRQMLQFQQSLTESLKAQLVRSHDRIAQLEADLALVQHHHTEQSHLLEETETARLDLQARLLRQQRQTFQFKSALEKCLESSPMQNSLHHGASGAKLQQWQADTLYSPLGGVPVRLALSRPTTGLFPEDSVGPDLNTSRIHISQDTSLAGDLQDIAGLGDIGSSTFPLTSPDPKPPQRLSAQPAEADLPSAEMPSTQNEKPLHLPLVFKEQPIRPWSASEPQLVTHAATVPRQLIDPAASTPQVEAGESNKASASEYSAPSTHSNPPGQPSPTRPTPQANCKARTPAPNSSPLVSAAIAAPTLESSQPPRSRTPRKSLAAVELPCFPRRS